MAWMWIGRDSEDANVYVNEEKGQVGFDPNGGEVPTADYDFVEFETLEDVLNILCGNNVTCMS